MATYWENSCSFGLRYVSWYKYLIVSLVFSHLGFWSGNLFLIAPFPDLCLLVPFYSGTPKFCMALLLFLLKESRTPVFKILVRSLTPTLSQYVLGGLRGRAVKSTFS